MDGCRRRFETTEIIYGMLSMKTKSLEKNDIVQTLDLETAPGGKKNYRRWIAAGAGALILMIIALMFFKGGGSKAAVQYKTDEVKRGNNTVSVGSELSGIVKTVDVNYNSKVKAGQILARLDTTKLDSQVTQSRAALESAKA